MELSNLQKFFQEFAAFRVQVFQNGPETQNAGFPCSFPSPCGPLHQLRRSQYVKKVVCRGGAATRPQILHSKICRRQAKAWLFPFGKSEKHSFSAGDQGSPLQA